MIALVREPLLHFVVCGAALYAVNHSLQERAAFTRITITPTEIHGIADKYRLEYGESPSPPQLAALVQSYIDDEMAYREALRLRLDVGDEVVRRRLVQKFKFLQQDLTTPEEPTEAELLKWYEEHSDRYSNDETVSFRQIFFSADIRGDKGAQEAARSSAAELNQQGPVAEIPAGDRFPGASSFTATSRHDLEALFGREGLAQLIFNVTPRQWSTPLHSGFGWHTVYVLGVTPRQPAKFQDVRERVRLEYLDAERNRNNAAAFAKLRTNFSVIREGT